MLVKYTMKYKSILCLVGALLSDRLQSMTTVHYTVCFVQSSLVILHE